MNKEQTGALPADPQHLEARSDARGRSHRASHEGRGGELSRSERPRDAGVGVQPRAAHARPRAQADPQDRRSDQAHRGRHATATASRPAKRSASSGSKRARSRPCASRRRSAANVGKSSTATGTIATAESAGRSAPLTRYRGRFAPSPTGPLHFGSLVAATASYLDARHAGGEWLLRIEDLDPPREVPGSADQIVATLAALGFEWNESISQTERAPRCLPGCARPAARRRSRSSPARAAGPSFRPRSRPAAIQSDELYYPGWCRNGVRAPDRPLAIRFRVASGTIAFDDRLQGLQTSDLARDTGDFVIRRRDSLFAYQLAVVVDDAAQSITHVVRGADLLGSTPRQIALQGALGLPTPDVRTFAASHGCEWDQTVQVDGRRSGRLRAEPARELWRTLQFLKQGPPPELRRRPGWHTLWEWAIETLAGAAARRPAPDGVSMSAIRNTTRFTGLSCRAQPRWERP